MFTHCGNNLEKHVIKKLAQILSLLYVKSYGEFYFSP